MVVINYKEKNEDGYQENAIISGKDNHNHIACCTKLALCKEEQCHFIFDPKEHCYVKANNGNNSVDSIAN